MEALERIRVITHSAIRIETAAGTVVYADPFDLTDADAAHDADLVLVTHGHYDHLSPEDIARVAQATTELVAPASLADEVAGLGMAAVHPMRAGERAEVASIAIEAVPAYNVEPGRLGFHPRANAWLGYVLTVDGARVYIAGDTDRNPDNARVSCDVALIPIGGTYTMDPAQAAAFVNEVRPKVAIPTHYGSVVGAPEDFAAFAAAVDPAIEVAEKMER